MKTGPLFVVAGLIVLAVLFFLFKPRPAAEPAAAPVAAGPGAPAVSAPPVAGSTVQVSRRFEIKMQGGKVSSPGAMSVNQGDVVVLRVTSDKADEMHLHGYELILMLDPKIPSELRFVADRTGRFEVELHKQHAELGAVEVQPRQ